MGSQSVDGTRPIKPAHGIGSEVSLFARETLKNATPANRAGLIAILIVAISLRAWGLGYGLPDLHHPDEPNKVEFAQRMIRTGDLNPHYFEKGTLLIYSTAAAQLAYYGWGRMAGWFESFDDVAEPKFLVYGTGWTASPGTFLAARWITVLLGTASVLLVYLCAAAVAGDPRAGLTAAAFMAIAPTPVESSRYITVDAYAVFFCLATAVFSLRILRDGRLRDYVFAGLSIGFAAGSKYPVALVLFAPVVAHLARGRWLAFGPLFAAAVASAVGFLVTTPYAVLAYQEFLRDLIYQKEHYTTGHVGMEGATAAYYWNLLWNVEGAVVCALAAVGLILLAARRRREGAVLLVFPLIYFASIVGLPVRNARTFLPILPFLYVLAGVAVFAAWKQLEALHSGRAIVRGALAAGLLFALWFPWQRTVAQAQVVDSVVAVDSARRWIEANAPDGSRIALEAYAPYIDPERYQVEAGPFLIGIVASAGQGRFDYLIAARRSYGRFFRDRARYRSQVAAYERIFAGTKEVARFVDFGSEIRILQTVPKPVAPVTAPGK